MALSSVFSPEKMPKTGFPESRSATILLILFSWAGALELDIRTIMPPKQINRQIGSFNLVGITAETTSTERLKARWPENTR